MKLDTVAVARHHTADFNLTSTYNHTKQLHAIPEDSNGMFVEAVNELLNSVHPHTSGNARSVVWSPQLKVLQGCRQQTALAQNCNMHYTKTCGCLHSVTMLKTRGRV